MITLKNRIYIKILVNLWNSTIDRAWRQTPGFCEKPGVFKRLTQSRKERQEEKPLRALRLCVRFSCSLVKNLTRKVLDYPRRLSAFPASQPVVHAL